MKVILVVVSVIAVVAGYEPAELRCLVCKATIDEMNKVVLKESDKKTIDVGSYTLDPAGNVNAKKKSLVESEVFLTEVMESVCDKMNNYLRSTLKSNGNLFLLNMMDMGETKLHEVDLIQDGDLNRSLEYLCKGILDEFDEEIVEVFGKRRSDPVQEVCVKKTELCEKGQTVRTDL